MQPVQSEDRHDTGKAEVYEHEREILMVMVLNQLYRVLAKALQDRWLGGLHAGLVIKGLYLPWMVAPFLRQGHKRILM